MFRSATTRIAHNSHVPGLAQAAISKDLKALQDLINAEKAVQQTMQRLGGDLTKAAEAAKVWGNGEGDDLGDTFTACAALLLHYANALARFSTHIGTVREQMKQVRTREENLDELKKRRKSLVSKADSADKKLSKMSGDHKNFQAQADSLNRLREEIRGMDTEILNEEANLGDFKRSSGRTWMGIKLGALAECCEKGLIVSDLGKLVIAEIPQGKTEPGLPRPYYTGHTNTEALVAEGRRRIDNVGFTTEANVGVRQLPGPELPPVPGTVSRTSSMQFGFTNPPSAPGTPDPGARNSGGNRFSQVIMSPAGMSYVGLPEVGQTTPGLGMTSMLESGVSPYQLPRSPPPGSTAGSSDFNPYVPTSYTDEFGAQPASPYAPRSSSLRNAGGAPASPIAGRFATFPTKLGGAGGPRPQPQASGSSFAPPRLDGRVPSIELERPDLSFSSSVAEALGEEWTGDARAPSSTSSKAYENKMYANNRDYSPPPPQYTPVPEATLGTIEEQPTGTRGSSSQHQAQPTEQAEHSQQAAAEDPFNDGRQSETEGEEESALAYMSPPMDNHVSLPASSNHSHEDRRVRFDSPHMDSEPAGVVATEPHPSVSEMRTQSPTARHEAVPAQSTNPSVPSPFGSPMVPAPAVAIGATGSPDLMQTTPPPVPTSPEEEEKALNAAAAREVSRELDALMFSSPLKTPEQPKLAQRPDPLEVPDRTFVRRYTPSRSSLGGDSVTSPTSLRNELPYVRERDRTATASPTSSVPPHSPTVSSSHGHDADDQAAASQPPPSIALPPPSMPSPAISSNASTPFKTPLSEFPAPVKGPGSFYNLPSASASGGIGPNGPRTISAAAFKRQLRSPSSPPPAEAAQANVSPLNVHKRVPVPRLDDPMARVSSAPDPARPASIASGHQEEDSYDYISAYMDEDPGSGQSQGYGSGRFATNLESRDGVR
ncbi:hypothetical protein PsYK624_074820 [Phanerochaete sordida]|uniref:Eisosome component PIL1-domain-containing protein n=1 Tax=Phanerochaete sordida TaxID=48140 RepID=A0A9P3LEB4_9APHY|nr:hypothetical protein PsYK624_074820 [Phanerochaete sordida]